VGRSNDHHSRVIACAAIFGATLGHVHGHANTRQHSRWNNDACVAKIAGVAIELTVCEVLPSLALSDHVGHLVAPKLPALLWHALESLGAPKLRRLVRHDLERRECLASDSLCKPAGLAARHLAGRSVVFRSGQWVLS
jgi:hypothetical protein